MTGKTITLAFALLVGATATAAAQSQRNYGANGPGSYGCYGSFSTGTAASSCPGTPEGGPWSQSQYRPYPQNPPYPQQYPQGSQWQWQRLH
jgi:hypothetical protein